mmetsp:Transcript_36306/g.54193  ORF Transcript_36306/g.54193 Transcript_36306/m.54193 type:complete len:120 (-) Transcript_36306:1169-1528(-)
MIFSFDEHYLVRDLTQRCDPTNSYADSTASTMDDESPSLVPQTISPSHQLHSKTSCSGVSFHTVLLVHTANAARGSTDAPRLRNWKLGGLGLEPHRDVTYVCPRMTLAIGNDERVLGAM